MRHIFWVILTKIMQQLWCWQGRKQLCTLHGSWPAKVEVWEGGGLELLVHPPPCRVVSWHLARALATPFVCMEAPRISLFYQGLK